MSARLKALCWLCLALSTFGCNETVGTGHDSRPELERLSLEEITAIRAEIVGKPPVITVGVSDFVGDWQELKIPHSLISAFRRNRCQVLEILLSIIEDGLAEDVISAVAYREALLGDARLAAELARRDASTVDEPYRGGPRTYRELESALTRKQIEKAKSSDLPSEPSAMK